MSTNSSTTQTSSDGSPEGQQILSHLVNRLLRAEGGSVPVERVTLRVSDFTDLSDQQAADLIDEGEKSGIYTLTRSSSGSATIDNVVSQGEEPEVITAAFGQRQTDGNTDFRILGVVTDSINDALQDAGYTDFRALSEADIDDLEHLTNTLTESRAEAIVAEAKQHVPVGHALAERAASYYAQRSNPASGVGEARVTDLTNITETVGEPRYLSKGWDAGDERGMYVSDVGRNTTEPIPTGLHILDNPDYPGVPKAETHPDASYDALPVDEDGEVIPPAVPIDPRLQLPLDELIAKKLARGLVPIRVVGPRGSGKNYLIKYLCHKTNRGYQSIDVDRATEPEDLFGPLIPDGDVIVPRNGAVKQGLINGDTIVINEFPVMQAGAAIALHRLLNEGTLLVKSHGELVEPHPSARLIITMNPPTREYRDSEPMNSATRGRFRSFEQSYIQDIDEEVETLYPQVNGDTEVVDRTTLKRIVRFAHKTRENENWPTLSTRNLTILCEHIEDGASPKAATKNELWAVAEPNQYPEDAHETLNDIL
ncbi:AAA family ATPase [Halomicroarcula sp. F24A]|uniref:AAA family ATPase n=1 Tax=Haloarcula salinisoli TaxID=2487746 RepID=A0A8J7YGB3_9EURY|nr:AAA family ATPase [Halomicroarcula salinisoli]